MSEKEKTMSEFEKSRSIIETQKKNLVSDLAKLRQAHSTKVAEVDRLTLQIQRWEGSIAACNLILQTLIEEEAKANQPPTPSEQPSVPALKEEQRAPVTGLNG